MNRALLAGTLIGLAGGCGRGGPETEAVPRVPVGIATVAGDTISDVVTVVGRLAPTPGGSALLTAPAAGVIGRIAVHVGATVPAGRLVIELVAPDLEQNARALAAAAEAAEQDARRQQDLFREGIASEKQAQQRAADAVAARAQADAASQLLSLTRVRSPIAGGVQRVLVHPGERVDAGAPLVEVINDAVLDLVASVPAADLPRLRLQQPAIVRVEGSPDRYAGRVFAIAPAVDSLTNAAQVVIRVVASRGALRAGTAATGQVLTGRRSGALVIPDSALVVVGEALAVFVAEGDTVAHTRSVTVGTRRDGRAEIVAGLQAGERVVVSGAFGLVDGMRIIAAAETPRETDKP